MIDLDRDVFEVYEGYQREPHDRGRFAHRLVPATASEGYWPMALVATWPLTQLPSDDHFRQTFESFR